MTAYLVRPAAAPQVTITSIEGRTIALPALKGTVVLVNFWATDCAVCVREMPQMARLYERFRGRGLEHLAVAMKHDAPVRVLAFARQNRLPFTVALDPLGEIAKAFGDVRLTPTTVVIDRHGVVALRITGAPDFDQLARLLEAKLAEPA